MSRSTKILLRKFKTFLNVHIQQPRELTATFSFSFFLSFFSEKVPGICFAHPMITTSSRSARSHSVVRALMSLSGTVGSGMAQIFSGSATNKCETILLSAGSDQSTTRSLQHHPSFTNLQACCVLKNHPNRLQQTQRILLVGQYGHIKQCSGKWIARRMLRQSQQNSFLSSSSVLYLPLWGMKHLFQNENFLQQTDKRSQMLSGFAL